MVSEAILMRVKRGTGGDEEECWGVVREEGGVSEDEMG